MRIKKLFAGVLAGAMVVGCMVMPSSAASTYSASDSTTVEVTTAANEWWYDDSFDFATLFPAIEYTDDIESVTFTWNQGSAASSISYFTVSLFLQNDPWYVQYPDVSNPYELDMDEFADISNEAIELGASTDAAYTVDVDYTYTAYDDTILYQLSEADLEADSYVVTLTSTSGRAYDVAGDTYCEVSGDPYIVIDVSEIPESETITVTSVTFN